MAAQSSSAPSIRSRRAAPLALTAASAAVGMLAICAAIDGAAAGVVHHDGARSFRLAALAVSAALVLDWLDGRVARRLRVVSDLGRELDSLADIVSFGVAPAVLVVTWGTRSVDGAGLGGAVRPAGVALAVAFVLGGAARLARFNTDVPPRARHGCTYFTGLPIPPAGACVAGAVLVTTGRPLTSATAAAALLLLTGALTVLMVSSLPYRTFKELSMRTLLRPYAVASYGSVLLAAVLAVRWVLLVLALAYVVSGIATRVASPRP